MATRRKLTLYLSDEEREQVEALRKHFGLKTHAKALRAAVRYALRGVSNPRAERQLLDEALAWGSGLNFLVEAERNALERLKRGRDGI